MTVIDRSDWYLELDGRPESDQFDLVSVVLHEISHGLGIVDSSNGRRRKRPVRIAIPQ